MPEMELELVAAPVVVAAEESDVIYLLPPEHHQSVIICFYIYCILNYDYYVPILNER